MRKLLVILTAALTLMVLIAPATAQFDEPEGTFPAYYRVAHLSPSTPAVVVFVDGEIRFSGLAPTNFTRWIGVEPGTYSVAVGTSGDIEAAAVGPVDVEIAAGDYLTIAAFGNGDTLTAQVIPEVYGSAITPGNARVTIFHAIEDAGAVDVYAAPTPAEPEEGEEAPEFNLLVPGNRVVSALAFPGSFRTPLGPFNDGLITLEVPAGSYELAVTPELDPSTTLLSASGVELEAGMDYFISAQGLAGEENISLGVNATDSAPLLSDILTIASGNENLSTLVAAIGAANASVSVALNGSGPFTVFAPTNEAFDAALDALGLTLDDLVANPDLLTDILQYHIVGAAGGGIITSTDLAGRSTVLTLQNEFIEVDGVTLNGGTSATVVTADIAASNGVVHVIDFVLLPPSVAAELIPAEGEEG